MHVVLFLLFLLAGFTTMLPAQPVRIDTSVVISEGDTNYFWVQIPEGYDPANPPAILSWWHGYGGDRHELLGADGWADSLNARHWIGACHTGGPNTHHYNGRIAQNHCRTMLDWIMDNYPFSRDSVYMVGSSMGAAAGFIWHNNHCGILSYPLAAAAGGSPILDCELRQHQYIDSGHINNAMIEAFGGIPDTSAAVDFEYHRTSAVHLEDTSQSMHFNSLHLPCYARWGTTDSSWSAEWFAYGHPAQRWDTLRQADNAETTFVACSGLATHGWPNLRTDSTLNWLSGFSVNRFPHELSINADESDEYYWTRVTLADTNHVFGRYGANYDWAARQLNINLIRNIAAIDIEFALPWWDYDSLTGHWINRDSLAIPLVTVRFTGLPTAVLQVRRNGTNFPFVYANDTLTLAMRPSGNYTVIFDPLSVEPPTGSIPREIRIEAAYPNPFNSEIRLEIASAVSMPQEIRLYDVTGRLARSFTAKLHPGTQHVTLSGEGLASGVYFVTLAKSTVPPVKIVLLK